MRYRAVLPVVFLYVCQPIALEAQDREDRLAAVVDEGRNQCSRLPYMEEFRAVERRIGDMYASRDLAYPSNAGEDAKLLPAGEAALGSYTRDQISALLTSMAVYRDCTFFFRDRFTFDIRLFRDDGTVFASTDPKGKLTLNHHRDP